MTPSAPNSPDWEVIKPFVERFVASGQIDPNALAWAKTQILPQIGLSPDEINSLGPVEVMLRLQKEMTKPANPIPTPTINVPNPVSNTNNDLNKEIEQISQNLNTEINEEIKRQIQGHHELNNAQSQVNDLVKKHELVQPSTPPQPEKPHEPTTFNPTPVTVPTPTAVNGDGKLTNSQMEFLRKIAENETSWQTLTSISESQWKTFVDLYKSDKLSEIGIAKSKLVDELKSPQGNQQVMVNSSDTIAKILEDSGFKLEYNHVDSAILGVHLLLNYALIADSHQKISSSGIALEPLPAEKEVLSLIKQAKNGNDKAFETLKDALTFLPVGKPLQIVKLDHFEKLQPLL